jgi:hypothetical protein
MSRQIEWLTAYVEKCMTEAWGDTVGRHEDVVTFGCGTAAGIVQVEDCEPVIVRVMAKAVLGVRASAKLLREINELNAVSRVANVWWNDGDVIVECSVFAGSVDADSLATACTHVATVANDIGVGFAAMFDGSTPLPPFHNDSEDAA